MIRCKYLDVFYFDKVLALVSRLLKLLLFESSYKHPAQSYRDVFPAGQNVVVCPVAQRQGEFVFCHLVIQSSSPSPPFPLRMQDFLSRIWCAFWAIPLFITLHLAEKYPKCNGSINSECVLNVSDLLSKLHIDLEYYDFVKYEAQRLRM